MKELIAGRILKVMKDEEGNEVQRSSAEIMAEAIVEGMEGKLVLSKNQYGDVIANPLHAVKLYQDYMLRAKELALRAAEQKKKEKGATGGIRIVLPSHVADPLLRPGQPPRPLRLLGQDPSKPLPGAGTPDDNQPPGSSPARGAPVSLDRQTERCSQPQSGNDQPQKGFDASELVEDFEDPICQFCLGVGHVRDENGIHMVTCHYCEGEGRAPAPEYTLNAPRLWAGHRWICCGRWG